MESISTTGLVGWKSERASNTISNGYISRPKLRIVSVNLHSQSAVSVEHSEMLTITCRLSRTPFE